MFFSLMAGWAVHASGLHPLFVEGGCIGPESARALACLAMAPRYRELFLSS
jgi:hypothetical protein